MKQRVSFLGYRKFYSRQYWQILWDLWWNRVNDQEYDWRREDSKWWIWEFKIDQRLKTLRIRAEFRVCEIW